MFGFNDEPTWSVPASFMSDIVPVCASSPFNMAVVPPTSEIKKRKSLPSYLMTYGWLMRLKLFFIVFGLVFGLDSSFLHEMSPWTVYGDLM